MTSVPLIKVRRVDTHRLIPSRFPTVGLLDRVADPSDLDELYELESWTNDRVTSELGLLQRVPRQEWVTGRPMSTVIMAAFCHPRTGGSRFAEPERGAWYAAFTQETSLREAIYHRTNELAEVGALETRVELREYLADFDARFHDIRRPAPIFEPLYDPVSYTHSQQFGRQLFEEQSNGIVYRSVRHPEGQCLACFRPTLVLNVRVAGHFELRWEGKREPRVRRL